MKRFAALLIVCWTFAARADAPPSWATGSWATGSWATGSWLVEADECEMCVAVPDVIGEADAAAADSILEGDGLDLGAETTSCSAATEDEIIGQNPTAGLEVEAGTLIDVTSSSGTPCTGKPLSIDIRERLGL